MQTFLPYPDFEKTAKDLDYRRLGKQRVEARQILQCLTGHRTGWSHHPAVLMWTGHEEALKAYSNVMIEEWIRRGYKNTMQVSPVFRNFKLPEWFGQEAFHASHRSNLLRKDPGYYGQFNWKESTDLPYAWPVRKK